MTDAPNENAGYPRVRRKLAAIFAADVAGYSKMMAADEEGATIRLADYRATMDAIIAKYGGRIANTAGDSVLAEFESSVEAVRSAVEIQEALRSKNHGLQQQETLHFRIGVNVGDVIAQGDDLLGDGVNVAARLEGLAEPGGICISNQVREQIEGKLTLQIVPLGKQMLKNIPQPIQVFGVLTSTGIGGSASKARYLQSLVRSRAKPALFGATVGALAIAAIFILVSRDNEPTRPDTPLLGLPPSPVQGQDFDQGELDEWAKFSISSRTIIDERMLDGHRYALVKAYGVKWVEAEAEARAMGGYLVAIATQAENDLVVSMIENRDDVWRKQEGDAGWQRFGPWIGLVQQAFDQEPAGGWIWSNGEELSYTNWFWHQPDNYNGIEHFGRFRHFSDQVEIRWDDARFGAVARGYIVEFEEQTDAK